MTLRFIFRHGAQKRAGLLRPLTTIESAKNKKTRCSVVNGLGRESTSLDIDWSTIIHHYVKHHRLRLETQLNWFRRQPSFQCAVITAAKAENERGLRYSHQRRVPRRAIRAAKTRLLNKCDQLGSRRSFHELWLLIKDVLEPVNGLGELYIYDTSLRIGSYFIRIGRPPAQLVIHWTESPEDALKRVLSLRSLDEDV